MPTVAVVDGIKIMFYNDEHPPPHFHARFGEHLAVINLETFAIMRGFLPRPQYRKVVAWARDRHDALRLAWDACERDRNPGQVV